MAAVDASEHQSLGGQYGVQGFPTIKIFGVNKAKPDDYNGKALAYIVLYLIYACTIEVQRYLLNLCRS